MTIALILLVICIPASVVALALATRMTSLSKRVKSLEEESRRLRLLVEGLFASESSHPEAPREEPPAESAGRTASKVRLEEEMAAIERQAEAERPAIQSAVPPVPPPPHLPPPSPPTRSQQEWEALIGGKLLNRIGALALIIGVGFFLKYAVDNEWLNETARVIMGGLAGGMLLAGASRSHRHGLEIFSQGLVGAGIAILYLSVYASFNFYHLVSQPVAFVLMAGVTIVAFLQAFSYGSLAVSLLGWAGGFLTPFMLATEAPNEIGLFSYIALLDAGLLVVAMKKERWAILEPLTVAATYLTYLVWYVEAFRADDLALTLFFLVVFWALFHTVDTVNTIRGVTSLRPLRKLAAAANAVFAFLALSVLLDAQYHNWLGTATLLMGLLYLATAGLVTRASSQPLPVQYAFSAIVLLATASAIEFSALGNIVSWSALALALVWFGRTREIPVAGNSGLGLYALAFFVLLSIPKAYFWYPLNEFVPLLNLRLAAFGALAVSMAISAVYAPGKQGQGKARATSLLHAGWIVLVFVLLTVETNDAFRWTMAGRSGDDIVGLGFQRYLTLSIFWSFYAAALAWAGLRKDITPALYASVLVTFLAISMATIRGIAFEPLEMFVPGINFRALTLIAVTGAAFMSASMLNQRRGHHPIAEGVASIRVAAVLLLLALFSAEIRDYFERQILLLDPGTGSTQLENLKQLSLSGVWLLFSIALMGVGIWKRIRSARFIAIALFGITIIKIFVYDLSFLETLYRIFSFIGLGIILLAVSYLYQRFKGVILEPRPRS